MTKRLPPETLHLCSLQAQALKPLWGLEGLEGLEGLQGSEGSEGLEGLEGLEGSSRVLEFFAFAGFRAESFPPQGKRRTQKEKNRNPPPPQQKSMITQSEKRSMKNSYNYEALLF